MAAPWQSFALLAQCAWPRRARGGFVRCPGARGERVQATASSPIVLAAMRGVGAEAQICNASAELAARDVRCGRRGGARCAIQGWQGACAMGGALIRITERDTRGCRWPLALPTPSLPQEEGCHKFEKLQRETRIVRGFVVRERRTLFVVRGRGSPRSSDPPCCRATDGVGLGSEKGHMHWRCTLSTEGFRLRAFYECWMCIARNILILKL